ncbi:unnamed protein product [Mytilus coruscus]|uniref:Link domain-containing protein n=1 Tax=Mytilus coruscus TaxID=42192 RepID=A0A6J8AZS2_MYTCO|nr:unnamed protein product [Mytilus coruscus]
MSLRLVLIPSLVEVTVTPSNTGNRDYDYKDGTEYIITPSVPMRMSYSLGKDSICRQKNSKIHTGFAILMEEFDATDMHTNTRRQTTGDICCNGNSFYQNGKCRNCPAGTISMYNGLFCGEFIINVGNVVDVIYAEQIMQDFTYADAVAECKNNGKKLASKDSLLLARDLGSQSCLCGWIEGGIVDSAKSKTDCDVRTQCQIDEYLKYAYCDSTYDLVTQPSIKNKESTTSGLPIGAIIGIILSVIALAALVSAFILYKRKKQYDTIKRNTPPKECGVPSDSVHKDYDQMEMNEKP